MVGQGQWNFGKSLTPISIQNSKWRHYICFYPWLWLLSSYSQGILQNADKFCKHCLRLITWNKLFGRFHWSSMIRLYSPIILKDWNTSPRFLYFPWNSSLFLCHLDPLQLLSVCTDWKKKWEPVWQMCINTRATIFFIVLTEAHFYSSPNWIDIQLWLNWKPSPFKHVAK